MKQTSDVQRGILVVDDEPALRDILQTHLRSQGFRVWTAASGEEALDHCCDHGDDIRELDVDIPVCFMTGHPGDYEPSELMRQGARHLFNKPFQLDEIVRVVRNLANEPIGWPQEI